MDLDLIRAIVERASQQLDLITVRQLHDLGLDKHAVSRLRAAGVITPVGRRTDGLAGAVDSFERRVLTACLDTGGVASHQTAARLHDLHRDLRHGPIEVTICDGRSHPPTDGWIVHSSTNLTDEDIVRVGPIPCASIRRRGAFVARVDTLFPGRVIVELEGHRPHRDQRRQDDVRRRKLGFAGYEVMVVTYDELVQDPAGVVADLTTTLAARAA